MAPSPPPPQTHTQSTLSARYPKSLLGENTRDGLLGILSDSQTFVVSLLGKPLHQRSCIQRVHGALKGSMHLCNASLWLVPLLGPLGTDICDMNSSP